MASKITKDFIEKAVKEPILDDFAVSSGSNPGDNVAGTLLAIKATGKSGTVYNLVYKYITTDDPAAASWAKDFGIFRIELAAYVHLVPRLAKFIEERSGIKYDSITPKFYDGFSDGDNDYLLLEDVRPSGYTMQDKFLGLNLQEVSLILKKIAEFHAASYFFIKEEGERRVREDEHLSNLVVNAWTIKKPEVEEMGRIVFAGCYNHCVELIKKNDPKLGEKLATAVSGEEVVKQMRLLNESTDKKHFPCIIHGDLWSNNIMIKYENDDRTKPVDIKFIDFQMTRRSDIFQELTYFLLCSTTPQFRKENYDQVLKVYYDSFSGFLQDTLKTKLPYGFNRGHFINTMYELLLPGFVHMCFAIPMQLADPVDFPAMIGEASAKLGVNLGPPPAAPNSDDSNKDNKDNQGPPPGVDIKVMMKLRNFMLYQQLEKSPRGVARAIQICQELADLKLI